MKIQTLPLLPMTDDALETVVGGMNLVGARESSNVEFGPSYASFSSVSSTGDFARWDRGDLANYCAWSWVGGGTRNEKFMCSE